MAYSSRPEVRHAHGVPSSSVKSKEHVTPPAIPIACDLGALTPEQRRREAELLAEFKGLGIPGVETPSGYAFTLVADAASLVRLGELLALERLCCPFLAFDLSLPPGGAALTLHIHGGHGAKAFVRDTFGPR